MKRILLILTVFTSFTLLAKNGEESNEAVKPTVKTPVTKTTDFPNPILKLWQFFIRDYNKFTNKNYKKSQSDTTVYVKKRFFVK